MSAALSNRIQPCLLDRLTDRNPLVRQAVEGPQLMSMDDYRRSVARDLRWLFSACAPPEVQPKLGFKVPDDYSFSPSAYARALETAPLEKRAQWNDLRRFPRAARSTIAYGMRQVLTRPGAWEERFKKEIERVLLAFEPRIVAETISVAAVAERQNLHVTITGHLLAFPTNRDFLLRARIDRETGNVQLDSEA